MRLNVLVKSVGSGKNYFSSNSDTVTTKLSKFGKLKYYLFNGQSIKNFFLYPNNVIKYVDMRGKNIIITGGDSGVGFMAARILSHFGANVIIASRGSRSFNVEPGSGSVEYQSKALLNGNGTADFGLIKSVPKNEIVERPKIDYMHLDLASKESIESFVKEYTEKYGELHVLINNAAISRVPVLWKTDQNAELQIGVNYLAPFYLTNLLVPNLSLKNGQKSRVINVTCHHYRLSQKNDFDDLDFRYQYRKYRHKQAYAQSKLYLLIFSNELNRRLNHLGIYSNAVNPGFVPYNTSINKFLPDRRKKLHKMNIFAKLFGKDLFTGAVTPVFAAADPSLEGVGGQYITNCHATDQYCNATDPEIGKKLWEASEKEWETVFDHTEKQ